MATLNHVFSSAVRFSTRRFGRREYLPTDRTHAWQLHSGYVRMFAQDDQDAIATLGLWRAGDIVGHFGGTNQPCFIECLTPVEATPVNLNNLNQHEILMAQLQQNQGLVRILHQKRVELRLLAFLQWLATQYGCPMPQGTLIDMPLTHQDIADAIGSTRVTVSRLIKRLYSRGEVTYRRHRYMLLGVEICES
ncbi:Crp/Fnr family transcriptional regulator [Leptolyngbya sp. AN02str]|uniref:Crp/Fnr family transcriptional regulator n=1 Tax=Leptolyngbya sp. AN02str TaxID=3423363 RepID=UPI003D3119BE